MDPEATPDVIHLPEERLGDPREQQEWFLRLPEHGKEELRRRWIAAEGRSASQQERRSRTLRRYLGEGAGIFFAVEFAMSPAGLGFVWAAVCGTLVGGLAWRFRAGTLGYMLLALAGEFLLTLLAGWFNLLAFISRVSFCAVAGAVHVLQRSDGSEPS